MVLTSALDWIEHTDCSCGCGFEASVAHDPANEGRFEVTPVRCFPTAAREWYREENKEDLTPSDLLAVRLLEPGETGADEAYDPATAPEAYELHQERMKNL